MFEALKNYLVNPMGMPPPPTPVKHPNQHGSAYQYNNVAPAQIPEDQLDFIRPSKYIPITEEMNNRRLELLSRPLEVQDLMMWIGYSLEDIWMPGREYSTKVWSTHSAALCSWMTVGEFKALSPPVKMVISDILKWWAGGPDSWRDLIEPVVEHWKIWAYYPDATWFNKYDEEKVGYRPLV